VCVDEGDGLGDYLVVAAEAGEPVDCGIFAEPCELAFGVVAMALLGLGDGLVAGDLAAQDGDGLGVAERGERATVDAIAFDELRGLFHQAAIEHLGGAVVDAGIELGAGRVETEAEDAEAGERVAALLPLAGDGLARGEGDLDGADELGRVVGVDLDGGGGVEAREDAVEMGGAGVRALAQLVAQRFMAGWTGEEAVEQRAQVEAGAAGDDGEAVCVR
jgi:hypothetical protein